MKKKIVLMLYAIVPVVALVALGVSLFGLSSTVGELRTEVGRSKADAILANANVGNDTVVSVPILFYDQKMDECVNMYDEGTASALKTRQFEWTSCGYENGAIETEMIAPILDDEYLPEAIGGKLLTNRGIGGENFKRWFNTVEGKSKNYAGTLGLKYNGAVASFSYDNDEFYPLNDIAVPDESVNKDGNNHLFTLNLGVPIQVLADGKEQFTIAADDDTWVYVGDKLVLDMGGVHDEVGGVFRIMENGEVYAAVQGEDLAYTGVKLQRESAAVIRIFHADRDSLNSVFRINFSNMLLNIANNATLARDGDGVEVAYDPQNPSYVAPLGESLTVRPDRSRAMTLAVIGLASASVVLMVTVVLAISLAVRYSRRDHSRGE